MRCRDPHGRALALLVVCMLGPGPGGLMAQSMEGTGVVPTGLLLRQLDGVKRVLMIGAHPDDEDTALLTTLARGWGVETAYLSLTRGDGGQNLIGSELWEGLGLVRTGELVAARGLDGGVQFFTRAFDFGYSKSAEEALTFWARDEVLADVVWVVRTFRPQVIVSVWSGTPRDGHGQHQASGILANEAFAAAADPTRFPEQLEQPGVEAWAADKLFQSRRRFGGGTADEEGVITVQTGIRDPLLGRSLLQLAMASRSQHRSQDMGASQPLGPGSTGVTLVESRVGGGADASIFAGVDTTLAGLVGTLPASVRDEALEHVAAYRSAIAAAIDGFGLDPSRIVPDLAAARAAIGRASTVAGVAPGSRFAREARRKTELATRALMAAAAISFDVRADDDLVVPGETVTLVAELWNGGALELRSPRIALDAPDGWSVTDLSAEGLTQAGTVGPGSLATWRYRVTVPTDADPSKLYYLLEPRDGAMYRWPPDHALWGLPWDPAPVLGRADFVLAGAGATLGGPQSVRAPWRYVGVDPARGEFDEPVLVVPAVSLRVSPGAVVWPQRREAARAISVEVRSEAEAGSRGTVSVRAPRGWSVTPSSRPFELETPGVARTFAFEVRPDGPPAAGDHVFEVSAVSADATYREGYDLIDYEHVERAALYEPSRATVSVVPVAVTEGLRVGYVMGSGDDGPEAIRQMGAEVDLLDEARVREGDFDGLDAVVLGVRAYETRPDLQAASAQLIDFARAGGTVVVQYNRADLGTLAPARLDVGRGSPRVSDETAPVTILAPDAPVFTTPNVIGPSDFRGWVQERGLYFAADWDAAYTPLLELNDPGEEPRRGALLVTSVGEGVFVYTALSFFRQWSDRVPGAYRLFANLVSLDPAAWRAFEGR